jgi:anti-anti-sigma factor
MESFPAHVAIEGDLTIFTVREWKEQLAQALAAHESLHVDLAGVTDFDTAGLQLLVLLKLEATAQNRKLAFLNAGPEVRQCLATYRLLEQFGLGTLQ